MLCDGLGGHVLRKYVQRFYPLVRRCEMHSVGGVRFRDLMMTLMLMDVWMMNPETQPYS